MGYVDHWTCHAISHIPQYLFPFCVHTSLLFPSILHLLPHSTRILEEITQKILDFYESKLCLRKERGVRGLCILGLPGGILYFPSGWCQGGLLKWNESLTRKEQTTWQEHIFKLGRGNEQDPFELCVGTTADSDLCKWLASKN